MILLLGGASETAPIAEGIARTGFRVMVSCATKVELTIASHPNISRRTGALNASDLVALVKSEGITLIVDATHPYATEAHSNAREAARQCSIPCLTYVRPETTGAAEGLLYAADHHEAARVAFSFGKPVLLTTGAKHIAPYAALSHTTGIPLIVRVLPEASSVEACLAEGIPEEHIVAVRGPFTVAQNQETIRRFSIGVVITKDSGHAGGTPEKIEAARSEGCEVIVIARPPVTQEDTFDDVEKLLQCIAGSKTAF